MSCRKPDVKPIGHRMTALAATALAAVALAALAILPGCKSRADDQQGQQQHRQPEPSTSKPEDRVGPGPAQGELHLVRVGGKAGFIDDRGVMVIAPIFADARPFDGPQAVARIGSKWGPIDRTGQWTAPPELLDPPDLHDDRTPVFGIGNGGEDCGYVDSFGRLAIGPQFQDGRPFHRGLAAVQRGHKWGFITPRGAPAIEPQFDSARDFYESRAAVWLVGKMGFVDRDGKMAIPPTWQIPPGEAAWCDFHDGRAAVRVDGKWGFVDPDGKVVIPPQFDAVRPFSEGLAAVCQAGRWGFVDLAGAMKIVPAMAAVDSSGFRGGLAAAADDKGLWGFIDTAGTWAIPARYKRVGPFQGRLAEVETDAGIGYIDKAGTVVYKPTR